MADIKTTSKEAVSSFVGRDRRPRERRLDFLDRVAARVITLGGISIILSVIAIVVFVGAGALPLMFGADESKRIATHLDQPEPPLLLLVDEYREQMLLIGPGGKGHAFRAAADSLWETRTLDLALDSAKATCAAASLFEDLIAIGDMRGAVHLYEFKWTVSYGDAGRIVQPDLEPLTQVTVFDSTAVTALQIERFNDGRIIAVASDGLQLRSIVYDPDWERVSTSKITTDDSSPITELALNHQASLLAVSGGDRRVWFYEFYDPAHPRKGQQIESTQGPVSSLRFLLGGNSLIVGTVDGGVSQWLSTRNDENEKNFRIIRTFDSHASPVVGILDSRRDRSFITLDQRGTWHLNHATSGRTYLDVSTPNSGIVVAALSPRSNSLWAIGETNELAVWDLGNEHPEATLRTLFGKVWYEGYDGPEYVWQSTGGTDEFEPKLSLIPLIFGTIKGTLYALLFAVPVAVMAAIYVSQLGHSRLRAIVKPTIEMMAAVPSVVVGFLAALWLAPFVESRLIGSVLALLSIPLSAVAAANIWPWLSKTLNVRLPRGWEPAIALPFIFGGVALALWLGPMLESALFSGDVRQWLFASQGIQYDPRNCIVVGFALGFAVIPIIFTVSEDALSSVPGTLVSGALALGATRWQATWRIVLRAASPGIFAAVMLGFGRAVGETMIVLMATGNTPVLDWSIFNGMRTMSAAIAVEIPEAPVGDTLYRVLFLTGFLLFAFTLAVNTVAGFVGTRLRRRYGRF